MDMQNKVTLDYRDNPELRDAFAGKQVGDKCKLTVEIQIDEMNDEGVVGTVESMTPDGYEPNDENATDKTSDEKGSITPDESSPVMMVLSKKAGNKAGQEDQ